MVLSSQMTYLGIYNFGSVQNVFCNYQTHHIFLLLHILYILQENTFLQVFVSIIMFGYLIIIICLITIKIINIFRQFTINFLLKSYNINYLSYKLYKYNIIPKILVYLKAKKTFCLSHSILTDYLLLNNKEETCLFLTDFRNEFYFDLKIVIQIPFNASSCL